MSWATFAALTNGSSRRRTGFLVPPDAPVELAAALRFLLSHFETADEMGGVPA